MLYISLFPDNTSPSALLEWMLHRHRNELRAISSLKFEMRLISLCRKTRTATCISRVVCQGCCSFASLVWINWSIRKTLNSGWLLCWNYETFVEVSFSFLAINTLKLSFHIFELVFSSAFWKILRLFPHWVNDISSL